ncbi:hypothetical protein H0H93_010479, partial [Arthromyces matolae]
RSLSPLTQASDTDLIIAARSPMPIAMPDPFPSPSPSPSPMPQPHPDPDGRKRARTEISQLSGSQGSEPVVIQ